jgi:hypothetical protein
VIAKRKNHFRLPEAAETAFSKRHVKVSLKENQQALKTFKAKPEPTIQARRAGPKSPGRKVTAVGTHDERHQ